MHFVGLDDTSCGKITSCWDFPRPATVFCPLYYDKPTKSKLKFRNFCSCPIARQEQNRFHMCLFGRLVLYWILDVGGMLSEDNCEIEKKL